MMDGLFHQELNCPYCGELITAEAEPGAGSHAFIEDCPVCCQPIEYRVEYRAITDPGSESSESMRLEARRDDDT